ncbi:MAG: aromatic ring hydroxylase [Gemmatimonadetes bacterium]|uniref:MIP18 family-like domain-containing protein n=1 Tax=marine metagenome TaxID=408172 RepID=A0A382D762_9ZZZZ|nr:aromatic ring hydroxylase [Gemmatimonadota bacterium]
MGVTEKDIQDVLRAVKDPELNLDLVVLGLIYDIEITDCDVHIVMSLTSPMCPVAEQLVSEVEASVLAVEGVTTCEVELTFDPPWTPERIAPLIRSSLGL